MFSRLLTIHGVSATATLALSLAVAFALRTDAYSGGPHDLAAAPGSGAPTAAGDAAPNGVPDVRPALDAQSANGCNVFVIYDKAAVKRARGIVPDPTDFRACGADAEPDCELFLYFQAERIGGDPSKRAFPRFTYDVTYYCHADKTEYTMAGVKSNAGMFAPNQRQLEIVHWFLPDREQCRGPRLTIAGPRSGYYIEKVRVTDMSCWGEQ
jgi:hypothetical protein